MTKIYQFVLSFICSLICMLGNAQTSNQYDSIPKENRDYWRIKLHYDSLFKNDARILEINERRKERTKNDPSYTYFSLSSDFQYVNATSFNNAIIADGFQPLKQKIFRINFLTVGTYNDGAIFEFNYFGVGLNNTAKKDADNNFKFSTSNLLELGFGYNPFKKSAISIYPMIGTSLVSKTLEYYTPDVNNINASPTNIVQVNKNWEASQFKIGYHAGLQLDLRIKKPTNYLDRGGTGIILFVRTSYTGVFGKDRLKLENLVLPNAPKIDPLSVRFGIKLFGTQYKKLSKQINRKFYKDRATRPTPHGS